MPVFEVDEPSVPGGDTVFVAELLFAVEVGRVSALLAATQNARSAQTEICDERQHPNPGGCGCLLPPMAWHGANYQFVDVDWSRDLFVARWKSRGTVTFCQHFQVPELTFRQLTKRHRGGLCYR